jgi:hypothetical protein
VEMANRELSKDMSERERGKSGWAPVATSLGTTLLPLLAAWKPKSPLRKEAAVSQHPLLLLPPTLQ